jgi:hypothetical protein
VLALAEILVAVLVTLDYATIAACTRRSARAPTAASP